MQFFLKKTIGRSTCKKENWDMRIGLCNTVDDVEWSHVAFTLAYFKQKSI